MKLYRSFATVGGWTMMSRILGFCRDIFFASAFGAGWVADAFNVAFRFPNLFRRLFGEGAFNAAFIPLFAKELEGDGRDAARRFAEEALSGLVFVLVVLSAVCILAMPWLIYLLAPGFSGDPQKLDLAILLTRITFPYLICMSVVALLSGVLNSFGRFAESSMVSVVLNVTLIGALMVTFALGVQNQAGGGIVQAIGVSIAGVLQLGLLIWGLRRVGFPLTLRRPRWSPGVSRLVTLGIPGVIAGGVTQINIMIGTMIASLQPGAVSQLYYADRLYELPLAIVGIAIGVVLLPSISRSLRAGDEALVLESQNRSLEFAMLLTVPAAVALALVPREIVTVLFERGAFTSSDTDDTAGVLWLFALGLPAFVMIKVFSPAYFAREDTKTPMQFATISLVANTIGSIGLFFLFRDLGWLPHAGIAAATALGGWLNALLLWGRLVQLGHFKADRRLVYGIVTVLLSSAIMGGVLVVLASVLAPWFELDAGIFSRVSGLLLLVGGGLCAYGLAALVTGALDVRQVRAQLRAK